jgi:RNA-binding protein
MELTSKQRAYLRGLANNLQPFVTIGKEGVTPAVIKSAYDALEAHELVKVSVQKNAPMEPREAAGELCEAVHAHQVQCIGYRFVMYRPSREPTLVLE